MLEDDGVTDFYIVIQPDQVEAYSKFGEDRLLILPENDKGLVYARNWITDHSIAQGHERHWQIDDDLLYMGRLHKGRRLKCDAGVAIAIAEDFVDRYENVALASFNEFSFVLTNKGYSRSLYPPFYLNHRCYTIILFWNKLPNRWRPPNNEDADMSLQVIADGWCTILFNSFLMKTLPTMQASGGQTEAFLSGARLEMVRGLERRWPGVVKTGRRFRHPQHFIKDEWRKFDTQLKLKKDVDLSEMEPNDYGLKLKAVKEVKHPELKKLLEEDDA